MLKFVDRFIGFFFFYYYLQSNIVYSIMKMCRLNECINKECIKIIEQRGGEGGEEV